MWVSTTHESRLAWPLSASERPFPFSIPKKALFVFFGRRRDAVKLLFFDGNGMCIFYKRLDQGTFRVPEVEAGATYVEIDDGLLDGLLDGIEVPVKRAVH